MADNVELNPGSGGKVIAADDVGGVLTQHIRLKHGTALGATATPFPVSAALRSDVIQAGETQLSPNFAAISLAASGDLVALVAGKKIRVLSVFLCVTTSGTAKFQSGGSADLTGTLKILDGTPLVLPFNPAGWFETTSGAKLNLVVGTSNPVSGCLTYILV